MKRSKGNRCRLAVMIGFLVASVCICFSSYGQIQENGDDKLGWWRDGRFGMFIHWGLYSQCEGYWDDKPIKGIGEWIFKIGKIPVSDYHELTKTFSAAELDVEVYTNKVS